MSEIILPENIAAFRRFGRFYTKQIGLLHRGLLKTRFPLPQARVLYELGQERQLTSSDIIREIDIDAGYLSRILSGFEKDGLVRKVQSQADRRRRILTLTAKGKKAFAVLNERSSREAEETLLGLSVEDRRRLLGAMQAIEEILGDGRDRTAPYVLRHHRNGDIGWITHRHGVVYAEEYGWDETFEALVADILVRFIRGHDPARERIWIAEQDGRRAGSVMLVDAGEGVAQLRLLLVEQWARGRGLGKLLIDECIRFARQNGYRRMRLWTQSNLLEARHLYEKAGFSLIEEERHHSFGHDLVAEFWELPLD